MKLIKCYKKVMSIVLALSLIAVVTGCSGQDSKTSPSPDASKIDNSSAKITAMTQEYNCDNIAEILMISYDGNQPDLKEYGGKNPEIESFNNAIKFGVQQKYDDFIKNGDSDSWIEIRSYPFTSDDYLQIVTACCTYPTYATDGDLYSYNFNLKENRFMSIDDVLQNLQLDRDSITNTVRGMMDKDGTTTGDVKVAGFLITQGPSGLLTQLLLQVDVQPPENDPWNGFFGYTPETGELVKLNSQCLFDLSDMDQMDLPLSYQTDMESASSNPVLFFDTNGMEEIIPAYEYLYDGMVDFTVEKLDSVSYSQDAVFEQIESLEPYAISLTNITQSDEHTGLLNSSCWLVVYYEGENEDMRHCIDVYVQTDTADYRLHTSIPADFELDYHDEIGRRLATVYWVE